MFYHFSCWWITTKVLATFPCDWLNMLQNERKSADRSVIHWAQLFPYKVCELKSHFRHPVGKLIVKQIGFIKSFYCIFNGHQRPSLHQILISTVISFNKKTKENNKNIKCKMINGYLSLNDWAQKYCTSYNLKGDTAQYVSIEGNFNSFNTSCQILLPGIWTECHLFSPAAVWHTNPAFEWL